MDDLIVTFCENRRSWLFVMAGTLGLCLVFLLPAVDEYAELCNEKNETADQLALAENSASTLVAYERRHAEQQVVLSERLEKTLNEQNEAEYRNSIVKLVRDSGCQLRRLHVSNPQSRDWGIGDDPLQKSYNNQLTRSGFRLQRRQVSLLLAGPSANVERLVERLEKQDKLVHVQGLDFKPSAGDGQRIELGVELWYFTLVRPAA